MIGQPYNPNNCCFLANQALNANQFDSNVPDTANTSVYILLWDFVLECKYIGKCLNQIHNNI
jgi:hypothetical protein